LLGERPNDVHTLTAKKIAAILQREFARQDAKSVKYACLNPLTTKVLTYDGFVYVDSIKEGDLVLTLNVEENKYEFQPVQRVVRQKDDLYRLHLSQGFQFDCTLDHKWLTRRGYVETRNLSPYDYIITTDSNDLMVQGFFSRSLYKIAADVDVFCLTTKNNNFIIMSSYTGYVTITGNCSYGAMPKKVAKTIGASEEVGKQVHEAFWSAALPLAELKKNLERYWETIGQKKFILGLDGRKIPTRSKSALINYLFQSAGVICTKRAAWFHDRMLRARGLICDFWVDDWRTKSYAQQLIHYHFDFMVAS